MRVTPKTSACFILMAVDRKCPALTVSPDDSEKLVEIAGKVADGIRNSPNKLSVVSGVADDRLDIWMWAMLHRYRLRKLLRDVILARKETGIQSMDWDASLTDMINTVKNKKIVGEDLGCALTVDAFATYVAEWVDGKPPNVQQARFFIETINDVLSELEKLEEPDTMDTFSRSDACIMRQSVRN
jgi:hypothetical protein